MKFYLRGFEIVSGGAGATVVNLPLVVDGVTRAFAEAELAMRLERRPEKMFVTTTFTRLDVKLPEEESRELIELNENPNVSLLQPIAEPKGKRQDDDLPWHFLLISGQGAHRPR